MTGVLHDEVVIEMVVSPELPTREEVVQLGESQMDGPWLPRELDSVLFEATGSFTLADRQHHVLMEDCNLHMEDTGVPEKDWHIGMLQVAMLMEVSGLTIALYKLKWHDEYALLAWDAYRRRVK